MEQRLPRLGDIVDDYCPRERRVTNHAIVAIVENAIRQTRCSTCQAEHEYKEAKIPKKKARLSAADAHDLSNGVLVPAKPAPNGRDDDAPAEAAAEPEGEAAESPQPAEEAGAPDVSGDGRTGDDQPSVSENWLAHRPLIRATLPRTEGEPPPRAIPEFTMHQRHGRGFGGRGFRHGQSGSGGFRSNNNQSNGNEPDGNRAPQPGRPGRRRRRRRPR